MAIPKSFCSLGGSWSGKSTLYTPWEEVEADQVHESLSNLRVWIDEGKSHARVECDWGYKGDPQLGTLVVCGSEKSGEFELAYVDSWHQSGSIFLLKGKDDHSEMVAFHGSYSGGEGPDWHWRIEFHSAGVDQVELKMFNIDPDINEMPAVEAVYTRV